MAAHPVEVDGVKVYIDGNGWIVVDEPLARTEFEPWLVPLFRKLFRDEFEREVSRD